MSLARGDLEAGIVGLTRGQTKKDILNLMFRFLDTDSFFISFMFLPLDFDSYFFLDISLNKVKMNLDELLLYRRFFI